MPDSPAPDRPRLVGTAELLALAGVTVIALVVLRPELSQLGASPSRAAPAEVDEVALAYLRAELAEHPEDVELRLQLARGQQQLERHAEARATLEPLLQRADRAGVEARLVVFEEVLTRWHRERSPASADAVAEAIQRLTQEPLSPEEREWLLRMALELGRPDMAAEEAERLALAESTRQREWLREAGRRWLEAQEPARAAEAWAHGAEAPGEVLEGEALAGQALDAARGMKDAATAMALAARLLERFPGQRALLDRAVALALAQGALAEANRWASERVRVSPLEVDAWRRRREAALAAGELAGALDACWRLVRLRPAEAVEWRWLARVAEWAGDPHAALTAWRWLALRDGSPSPVSQAVRVAQATWDTRSLVEVLTARAHHGELTDQELNVLVEAYEHLGEPEQSERWLLSRPTSERLRRLAQLQEQQGRLAEALATWETLKRKGEPVEALQKQAELLWRLGQAPAALERLRAGGGKVKPEQLRYWRLRAELAWSLDADVDAREAYQVLWEHEPEEPLVRRRLALLLAAAGREAMDRGHLEEARARYARSLAVDEHYALARIELLWLLIRGDDRAELGARLEEWRAEAEHDPAYFEPYARAHQLLGNRGEAAVWFGRRARAHREDGWAAAEYAQALEDAGESEAAREALGLALGVLRPEVEAEAEQLPAPESIEKIFWALHVAERLGGAPDAEAWGKLLRQRAGDAPAVQDWALARSLEQGDLRQARHWIGRMRRTGRQPPAWVALRVTLEDGSEAALAELLEVRGSELSLLDRVVAERRLGRSAKAWALLASLPREGLSPAQLQALESHERELSEQRAPRAWLDMGHERIGQLSLARLQAEGRTEGPGGSLLRARVAHHLLEEASLGARARETELSLGAMLGSDLRPTELWVGLSMRGSGVAPLVRVRQQERFSPGFHLTGEAAWGESASESPLARLFAVRHRLSGTAALGVPANGEISATVEAREYQTWRHSRLGEGVGGAVRAGWPWASASLHGRLELGGTAEQRWLQPTLPGELASTLPSASSLLPERSGSLGMGASLGLTRKGELGGSFLVEAWGGWLWPEGEPGYHLRLGSGLVLPHVGELTARIAFGSVLGGARVESHRVLEAGWMHRF